MTKVIIGTPPRKSSWINDFYYTKPNMNPMKLGQALREAGLKANDYTFQRFREIAVMNYGGHEKKHLGEIIEIMRNEEFNKALKEVVFD